MTTTIIPTFRRSWSLPEDACPLWSRGGWQRGFAARTQCFAPRRVLSEIGVARFHRARESQVSECVFVGAAYAGIGRQGGERIERGQHLRRRAFEEAPAAELPETAGRK